MPPIVYTKVDESPALATYSLLPILKAFGKKCDVEFELKDISLSGRILSEFLDFPDDLAYLGKLTQSKDANIIKLPNISASIPQLKAAIKELQSQGFTVPDLPENITTTEDDKIKAKYLKILGSAVNPVLREGNSDRRAPKAVKNYAKNNPHLMGEWKKGSKTHVSFMDSGDFYGSEQSYIATEETFINVEFIDKNGKSSILKSNLKLQKGEILDASFMSMKKVKEFFLKEIKNAKEKNVLFSVHLKATMMKISDPVIFGAAVLSFFEKLFQKHKDTFEKIGVNPNNGLGDLYIKIANLPQNKREEIENDISNIYKEQPDIAMVDSEKGITNLHFPNDVIVDASMPAMIRAGGIMWDKDGQKKDVKTVIPDRCYAGVYQAVIEDCQKNGAFDPKTMGSVPNVGLMAQKAEEYGSHDKTFIVEDDGTIFVKDKDGQNIFEIKVAKGDIFRMCQTKDMAVQDWVKLAYNRAKATKTPVVFWLDENRLHDQNLIKKVKTYLKDYDISELDIKILSPIEAVKLSLKRLREGKDTISATGNVLRDYLTDLFPILELGTSAKMLSIVPLINGGGLFETGAGGSAPKLAQQLLEENHLRWDSLGEFMALFASVEHLSQVTDSRKALILSRAIDEAIEWLLQNNKLPKSKCGELDNRGSHFYFALYLSKALMHQKEDIYLSQFFTAVFEDMLKNEKIIVEELNSVQGVKVDIGGYYHIDDKKASSIMRPSKTFNSIIDNIN